MTTVLNFYINHFIDKIKRDHEIIFIHNDKNDTLYINFELVSQYTDFFKPKLGSEFGRCRPVVPELRVRTLRWIGILVSAMLNVRGLVFGPVHLCCQAD